MRFHIWLVNFIRNQVSRGYLIQWLFTFNLSCRQMKIYSSNEFCVCIISLTANNFGFLKNHKTKCNFVFFFFFEYNERHAVIFKPLYQWYNGERLKIFQIGCHFSFRIKSWAMHSNELKWFVGCCSAGRAWLFAEEPKQFNAN